MLPHFCAEVKVRNQFHKICTPPDAPTSLSPDARQNTRSASGLRITINLRARKKVLWMWLRDRTVRRGNLNVLFVCFRIQVPVVRSSFKELDILPLRACGESG